MVIGPQEALASLRIAGWVGDRLPSRESVKERVDEYRNPLPDGIKGCIERDDVLWRFDATLNIEDRSVENVTVRDRPTCPECRAELKRTRDDLLGSESIGGTGSPYSKSFDAKRRNALSNRPFWDCAACNFTVSRDTDARSDVETLARRDIERIIESREKPYSLPALVKSVEEVDARSVWEAYVDTAVDDHVSTECFH